ncbi:16S rRNA processing protein RimM [Bifidobacterium aemilianum]|uniref:Ribosome maturation factor RimM n=1 Tax=Bifidobacterium aemilianum TaxID=2493120 RepID=A0A366K731_9BIFI|nr:ribosome maturation factor RimM [Bifidobacterium aemilianum]RBP97489.1 16S rRNA processing protein RimM [Bifidobacterium aemilianum]
MQQTEHHEDPQQVELLRVCRIGKAQGLKGEVNVMAFTDEPERRFAPGAVLYSKDGSHEFTVLGSRSFKNRWIVLFEGVNNRDKSEALRGVELYGPADDPEEMAEEDAWYPKDLIGLRVELAEDNGLGLPVGQLVGTVVDVIDGPAQSLLKLRRKTKATETQATASPATEAAESKETSETPTPVETTALVPFVDQLVPDIDLSEGYLTLDPPGGLIPWL